MPRWVLVVLVTVIAVAVGVPALLVSGAVAIPAFLSQVDKADIAGAQSDLNVLTKCATAELAAGSPTLDVTVPAGGTYTSNFCHQALSDLVSTARVEGSVTTGACVTLTLTSGEVLQDGPGCGVTLPTPTSPTAQPEPQSTPAAEPSPLPEPEPSFEDCGTCDEYDIWDAHQVADDFYFRTGRPFPENRYTALLTKVTIDMNCDLIKDTGLTQRDVAPFFTATLYQATAKGGLCPKMRNFNPKK